MKAKLFFALFILITTSTSLFAQQRRNPAIVARVDKRIELTSIVVRLAEYDEYVRNDHKLYAADVDNYFSKYKDHPVVALARKLRESNGIGFDAVPSLAVHLKPDLTPKLRFTDSSPDKRWGGKNAEEFARLLRQFYKDADCETFFRSHAGLYKIAEERFKSVLAKVDLDWYRKFYGEIPAGSFNLYIGLLNGGMNFGPKVVYPDGKEELFAVIGTWKTDEKGLPIYGDDFLSTIIHEFNHSFVNHLVHKGEAGFRASGEKIFPLVEEKMKRQAYGNWQTTVLESLVRAAVVRYLNDHEGTERANAETILQRGIGFVWMDELTALLGTYEMNRTRYPTFRSFMAVVQTFYNGLAGRIETEISDFAALSPKVVAIQGFKNGDQTVDPGIEEITIVFDRPMLGKGISINLDSLGEDHFPIKPVFKYSPDNISVTINAELKPNWEYGFVLTGLAFKSKDGYPLQTYAVRFKTRKE